MTDIIDYAAGLEERERDWLIVHRVRPLHAPPLSAPTACGVCGSPIGEARRRALPGCRLCVSCQKDAEEEAWLARRNTR